MYWFSILAFFGILWGLGYSICSWLKEAKSSLERNAMRIGTGLGAFAILGSFYNIIGLSIDWRWFLLAAIPIPTYSLIQHYITTKSISLPFPKSIKINIVPIFVMILFLGTFYIYSSGAFAYPYLENDDPYGIAEATKFVSIEKTLDTPIPEGKPRLFGYLDPYPPAYVMLMGVMHQTNDSLNWTLKFFNALILALGVLFLFFFLKDFMGDQKKALFATFILASIPAYLTHFIWAHSLIITMFYPALYALERMKKYQNWWIVLAVIVGGIFLTQPSQPIKLGLMIIFYLGIRAIQEKKIPKYELLAGIVGALLSVTWWATHWRRMVAIKAGTKLVGEGTQQLVEQGGFINVFTQIFSKFTKLFPAEGGSATRVYNFNDFFYAKGYGLINNPVGIGIVVYLLMFVALIYFCVYFTQQSLQNKMKTFPQYASIAYIAVSAFCTMLLGVRYLGILIGQEWNLNLYIDLFALIGVLASGLILSWRDALPESSKWTVIGLSWAVFAFLFVNAMTFDLPIGFKAFRTWMIFAIAIAPIATQGAWFLGGLAKSMQIPAKVILFLLIIGIAATSLDQKHNLNTSPWFPGGAWTSQDEISSYAWIMNNLPKSTNVFPYSGRDQNMIAFDMYSCKWCPGIKKFRSKLLDHSPEELHAFLKLHKYEYLLFDMGMSIKYIPAYLGYKKEGIQERIQEKIKEVMESGKFTGIRQTQSTILLKVV